MGARPVLNIFLDGNELVILHRDAEGKVAEERRKATWDCFVHRDRVSPGLRHGLEQSAHLAGIREEGTLATHARPYLRLQWRNPEARRKICSTRAADGVQSPFAKKKIPVFEGDVHPVRRYLADRDVEIQAPRRVFLDIEVDSRKSFDRQRAGQARVLCWTLVEKLDDGSPLVVDRACLELDDDEDECRVLRQLWASIAAYDQVAAWNSRYAHVARHTYDFQVVFARSKALGVRHRDERYWTWVDHCKTFFKVNMQVAESGDEKASAKLDDIAEAVCGLKKRPFSGAKTWEAWEAGRAPRPGVACPGCGRVHDKYGPRRCLEKYNEWDTVLCAKVEHARPYLALLDSIGAACGILPDSSGVNALTQVDTYLLRLGGKAGYRFPTVSRDESDRDEEDEREKFRGAYVLKPTTKGMLRNVHVCDFSRLYPSIVDSFNMSTETKVVGAPLNGKIAEGHCRAPTTGMTFRTDVVGIIPSFLREVARLRKVWNDRKAKATPGTPEWHAADRMSNAYKVIMNACYGILGSPFSRYFDVDIAESITQTGVYIIKRVIADVEARGWSAVAGDTDSSFVLGPSADEMRAFVKAQNDNIHALLPTFGCKTIDVSLAYEKEFRVIFWALKGDGEPAAKNYVGVYAHYKGSVADVASEPEIKGLEFKRGDKPKLARRLQERVIRMVVGDWECPTCRGRIGVDLKACPTPQLHAPAVTSAEAYRDLVARARDYVLHGDLKFDEIVVRKGLNKPLSQYAEKVKNDGKPAAQQAHVAVAKVLEARGADVGAGAKIAYVVVDASSGLKAVPADDWKPGDPFDRYYLWESLVWPAQSRVLAGAFPEQSWSEFDVVRPRYRAPKKGGAGEGQASLFAPPPAASAPDPTQRAPVVAPMRRRRRDPAAPYVIVVTTEQLADKSAALREVLARYPGSRPVHMRLRTVDASGAEGAVVHLDLKVSVAGTLELAGEVARLLGDAAA